MPYKLVTATLVNALWNVKGVSFHELTADSKLVLPAFSPRAFKEESCWCYIDEGILWPVSSLPSLILAMANSLLRNLPMLYLAQTTDLSRHSGGEGNCR